MFHDREEVKISPRCDPSGEILSSSPGQGGLKIFLRDFPLVQLKCLVSLFVLPMRLELFHS